MGFSEKQVDTTKEPDAKKWLITGIGTRTPLKPISPKVRDDGGDEEECPTTPTSRESRIPGNLTCPPAPRKRRPVSAYQVAGGFFVPPDLESVFIRHGETAQ